VRVLRYRAREPRWLRITWSCASDSSFAEAPALQSVSLHPDRGPIADATHRGRPRCNRG
jgi:hypothetical protein